QSEALVRQRDEHLEQIGREKEDFQRQIDRLTQDRDNLARAKQGLLGGLEQHQQLQAKRVDELNAQQQAVLKERDDLASQLSKVQDDHAQALNELARQREELEKQIAEHA